jgi:hypothetical protein
MTIYFSERTGGKWKLQLPWVKEEDHEIIGNRLDLAEAS